MPNFNENNIGFTKFCQENLKSPLSIKLLISKFQIVKPSDILFYILP
jgi:hypothetical protein